MLDKTITGIVLALISCVGLPLFAAWITTLIADHIKQIMVDDLGEYSQVAVGGLGVIIHELAHLTMAVVFEHRIDHLKLLTVKNLSQSPTLGSVSHTWNTYSWYQDAGNFLIGIAPFYACSLVLWLVFTLLGGSQPFPRMHAVSDAGTDLDTILNIISADFSHVSTGSIWSDLVFVVLIVMIASTGYSLSKADLKNTLHGIVYWSVPIAALGAIEGGLNISFLNGIFWNVALFTVTMTLRAVVYIGIVWIILYAYHDVQDRHPGHHWHLSDWVERLRYRPKHVKK